MQELFIGRKKGTLIERCPHFRGAFREKGSAVFASISIAEEAQEYGKMFSSIERYSQLRNYFIGCHKVSTAVCLVEHSSKPG